MLCEFRIIGADNKRIEENMNRIHSTQKIITVMSNLFKLVNVFKLRRNTRSHTARNTGVSDGIRAASGL